jgi:isopentenyl phosphate kinase
VKLPQILRTSVSPTEGKPDKYKHPPVTTVKMRKKNNQRNNIYYSAATIDITGGSNKKVFVIPALKQIYDLNSQSPIPDTTPF